MKTVIILALLAAALVHVLCGMPDVGAAMGGLAGIVHLAMGQDKE
jgi:hypothetical protein